MAESTLTGDTAASLRVVPSARRGLGGSGGALLRIVAAVTGGVLLALAFPPVAAWPLAPIGVSLVLLATHRSSARYGALLGLLAGLGLFVPHLQWMGAIFFNVDATVVGGVAWIGLAVLQAAFYVPLGAGLALVSRLPGWYVWSAALWVTMEAVRGRIPFGGFTWGTPAFSQGHSAYTPFASLGGAPLVTFLVVLTGGLAGAAVLRAVKPGRDRRALAAIPAVVAVCVPALGLLVPLSTSGQPVTVAAVQGDVPVVGLKSLTPQQSVLDNHVEATRALARQVRAGQVQAPDFVVWPESAADIDPYANAYARERIQSVVEDVGAPILVGTTIDDYTRNVGIVWDPETGPGDTYLKRRLVPFAEYIPFRSILEPRIDLINDLRPRDLVAGDRPGDVTIAGTTVADTICFDIAYHNTVREAVNGGGKVIVVQTNNATFNHTSQPEQQLAIERLRAVEHGRAVVVAATSGISAIIAPDGRMLEVSEPLTREILVETIPARDQRTLSDRLGATPVWLLAGTGFLAVVAAITPTITGRPRAREQDQ